MYWSPGKQTMTMCQVMAWCSQGASHYLIKCKTNVRHALQKMTPSHHTRWMDHFCTPKSTVIIAINCGAPSSWRSHLAGWCAEGATNVHVLMTMSCMFSWSLFRSQWFQIISFMELKRMDTILHGPHRKYDFKYTEYTRLMKNTRSD